MNWKSPLTPVLVLSAATALAATACSGGGGGSAPSTPRVYPTAAAVATSAPQSVGTTAVITIAWPVAGASSASRARRSPDYVSPGTASVSIAVDGTTTEVDNPNLTPGGTGSQTTSAISVVIPPSTAPTTFTVTSYDKTGGASGTGDILGIGTAQAVIVQGQANPVNITLNGDLASIGCLAGSSADTATNAADTAFLQVGVAGSLILVPKDAKGFTIVAPGNVPGLLLATGSAMGKAKATSTANEYSTTVTVTGTAVTFAASGTNLAGQSITQNCSITRDAAMYVSNVGQIGSPTQQSITIYDATVLDAATLTSAAAPVSTIEAPAGMAGTSADKTEVVEPQFLAVDANGYLFVTNQGPLPGTSYGPKSGYVAIYAPGQQSGNVAPVATITGLNRPEGIAFDSSGNLYVLDIDSIFVYPPTADGETAPAVASPKLTITGAATDLSSCYGMSIDVDNNIYAACSDVLDIFNSTGTAFTPASGNATPTLIELPEMTSMSFDSVSWLDVATDSTMNFYAPASNNNATSANNVYSFQAGTTMGAEGTPDVGTGFSQPTGIAVDASDGLYVTNYGNSSVEYFGSATLLDTGVSSVTLSGATTGLNNPFGVTVR